MPLMVSGIVVALMLLIDLYRQSKRHAIDYVAMFFLVAGFGYFLQSNKIEASPFAPRYLAGSPVLINGDETKEKQKSVSEINKEFIKKCKDKMDENWNEGVRCLREAEKACIWLPETSDQEKALACFANFMTFVAPGTPAGRAINTLLAMCGEYGLSVLREWQYVDSKLRQAKMHFELEEFYRLSGKRVYDTMKAEK